MCVAAKLRHVFRMLSKIRIKDKAARAGGKSPALLCRYDGV